MNLLNQLSFQDWLYVTASAIPTVFLMWAVAEGARTWKNWRKWKKEEKEE
jgi:hypothetical protein